MTTLTLQQGRSCKGFPQKIDDNNYKPEISKLENVRPKICDIDRKNKRKNHKTKKEK